MSTIEQEPFVDLAVDNSDEAKRDASLRIIARAALPGWCARMRSLAETCAVADLLPGLPQVTMQSTSRRSKAASPTSCTV